MSKNIKTFVEITCPNCQRVYTKILIAGNPQGGKTVFPCPCGAVALWNPINKTWEWQEAKPFPTD